MARVQQPHALSVFFLGKTRQAGLNRNDWTTLLPTVSLKQPIGVVDLGGNAMKSLALVPDSKAPSGYQLFNARAKVINGNSIGTTGKINKAARAMLADARDSIKAFLDSHGVTVNNMLAVATAGLRSAENKNKALRIAQGHNAIAFKIISGKQEAALIYPSVLMGEGIQSMEQMLVIEIGGGSTELVFGTGPETVWEGQTQTLEIGTGRLNLQNPFSAEEIQQRRLIVRGEIQQQLRGLSANWLKKRRVFIKSSNLEDLRVHHLKKYHDVKTPQDILETALTHKQIKDYLTQDGLSAMAQDDKIPYLNNDGAMKLVAKLLILDELMTFLIIPEIELGFNGGLKFALLRQMLLQKQKKSTG